jgi:class 3 adenylate cyclase
MVDPRDPALFAASHRIGAVNSDDRVAAVAEAQLDLAAMREPEGAQVKVRMGLHTGEPNDEDGPAVLGSGGGWWPPFPRVASCEGEP